MFSSQLNQVLAQVSGTILMSPFARPGAPERELGGVDIPLVGEPRLDHHARAVAEWRRDHAVLDADQRAFVFERWRRRALRASSRVEAEQVLRDEAVLRLDDVGLARRTC